MRAHLVLALLALPLVLPLAPAGAVALPCGSDPLPVDGACPAKIRPGARSNVCTLNFVVTDGIDLFIGAAGHCAAVGGRVVVAGLAGEVGTVVLSRANFQAQGDWAFVRIDPEDRVHVDPTMARVGGPHAGPGGLSVRPPLVGEAVLHYGHGASAGAQEATRARAGVAIPHVVGGPAFSFAGSVDVGDSGSPVRLATGEAAGIAVATLAPGRVPNLVVASRFDRAMADLASSLGRPVSLVEGDPLAEA